MKYVEKIKKHYTTARNNALLVLVLAVIYPSYVVDLFLKAAASAFSLDSFKDYLNSL